MLEILMDKLKLKEDDTINKAALKGVGLGMLEGLVVVGAVHTIANLFNQKK